MTSRYWRPLILSFILLALMAAAVASGPATATSGYDHFTYLPVINTSVPYALWANAYGGSEVDYATSIIETAGGGFAISGRSQSSFYNLPGMVLKLTKDGAIQWIKAHQVSLDPLTHIQEADDGSLIATGPGGNYGFIPVIKHRPDGSVAWKRSFDTDSDSNHVGGLVELDGGAVVAGTTNYVAWAWRLNSDGSTAWRNEYVGFYYIQCMGEGADSGVIVAGYSWVMKLNSDGSIAWQKGYTTEEPVFEMSAIRPTEDGGYVAVGRTTWDEVAWLLKLAADGSVEWSRVLDTGENRHRLDDVQQSPDGGYIAAGTIDLDNSHVSRGLAVKLASDGQAVWAKTLGEGSLWSVAAVSSGGYAFAGGRAGDVWVLRTDPYGSINDCDLIQPIEAISVDYPATAAESEVVLEAQGPGDESNFYTYDASLVRMPLCPAYLGQSVCPDLP